MQDLEATFFSSLYTSLSQSELPPALISALQQFYRSYEEALKAASSDSASPLGESDCERVMKALHVYIDLIRREVDSPKPFGHFHAMERSPFDYYRFGLDMVFPLIKPSNSIVLGKDALQEITSSIKNGENVLLLANHQAEIDPQIISLLTAPFSREVAEESVFVAGHRVTTDPLAIPFSRGRNLICINSKKYIDHPPELRSEKLMHNARAISHLESLLDRGGVCLYVAPSGGRDRYADDGISVDPAPFDPQSVEMFRLIAQRVSKPTHIHVLALHTIDLLPPPRHVNIDLGEERIARRAPCGLFFGPRVQPSLLEEVGAECSNKQEKRKLRAEFLTGQMKSLYRSLVQELAK